MTKTIGRRQFLATSALAAGGLLMTSRLALAGANSSSSRFVFLILRGALDGLSAAPPHGDPAYARIRGELALAAPGAARGALKLDDTFGLHPSLQFLGERHAAKELLVFHAVASPYRERSHFDGQDVLESGHVRPHASHSGWLNRALATIPGERGTRKELGVAVGQNVPLVMRGEAPVVSWSPSRLAPLDEDTLERITDLYAKDPVLSKRLADALAADAIATAARGENLAADAEAAAERDMASGEGGENAQTAASGAGGAEPAMAASEVSTPAAPTDMLAKRDKAARRGEARYTEVIRAAGAFLRQDDGPRIAVLDSTGWDTHSNEGAATGQLAFRLRTLDAGLRTLREQLGPVWKDTAVLIATEFGRTAAINGTRGTDHGTGAAAFLVGGAVAGGRVIADWPGLSAGALHEGRDLRPTLDLRSVLKGVLSDHLRIPRAALESRVFPDSRSARPVTGLMS